MKKNENVFPDWIFESQVDDDLFGEAYESTPPHLRAWLKKTIAQLWLTENAGGPVEKNKHLIWNSGFSLNVQKDLADAVILVLDSGTVSPVRVLGALVPALVSGIKNILAVNVSSAEIPSSILAAFELSGQENVVSGNVEFLSDIINHLKEIKAFSVILDLRAHPQKMDDSPYIRYWKCPQISKILLCAEITDEISEIVTFAHPDIELIEGGFSEAENFYAAIVPDTKKLGNCISGLVLGSGQEGCWMWLDLHESLFTKISYTITDSDSD